MTALSIEPTVQLLNHRVGADICNVSLNNGYPHPLPEYYYVSITDACIRKRERERERDEYYKH